MIQAQVNRIRFYIVAARISYVIGDQTEAAYRRGDLFDKRKQLMAAWTRYCKTPMSAGKVVPIRGGRAK